METRTCTSRRDASTTDCVRLRFERSHARHCTTTIIKRWPLNSSGIQADKDHLHTRVLRVLCTKSRRFYKSFSTIYECRIATNLFILLTFLCALRRKKRDDGHLYTLVIIYSSFSVCKLFTANCCVHLRSFCHFFTTHLVFSNRKNDY